jgi:hypothetical protein
MALTETQHQQVAAARTKALADEANKRRQQDAAALAKVPLAKECHCLMCVRLAAVITAMDLAMEHSCREMEKNLVALTALASAKDYHCRESMEQAVLMAA